jgi:hypothetical protein
MEYGEDLKEINNCGKIFSYGTDNVDVHNTNGARDVRVTNASELTEHLRQIGFNILEYEIKKSFSDLGHDQWIYVHAIKV